MHTPGQHAVAYRVMRAGKRCTPCLCLRVVIAQHTKAHSRCVPFWGGSTVSEPRRTARHRSTYTHVHTRSISHTRTHLRARTLSVPLSLSCVCARSLSLANTLVALHGRCRAHVHITYVATTMATITQVPWRALNASVSGRLERPRDMMEPCMPHAGTPQPGVERDRDSDETEIARKRD